MEPWLGERIPVKCPHSIYPAEVFPHEIMNQQDKNTEEIASRHGAMKENEYIKTRSKIYLTSPNLVVEHELYLTSVSSLPGHNFLRTNIL